MTPMLQWLYDLRHFGVKLGLDNIRALLEILDHPEAAYRNVHVAGTNGKGSVAAMLDGMLAASGLRPGLFTSPHLVRPNERIRIDGEDIGDDELDATLRDLRERIEAAVAAGRIETHPSFFETIAGAALLAFRKHGLDVAVLEVGLGGRLDATNAVATDVSVIVNVDLDHMKTLGPTIAHIAREKAGIVKPGVPVVSGVTRQVALDVVRGACRERDAPFVDARLAVRLVRRGSESFDLATARGSYPSLALSLPGSHQIDNARIALAAFELLAERMGREVDPDAVREGLAAARWPGRLQWLDVGGLRFLLDAAHNPAGMATLADYLRTLERKPSVAVFGATSGKPVEQLLEPLAEFVPTAVITSPPVDRGLPPEEVGAVARRYFDRVEVVPEWAEALPRAKTLAAPGEIVLLTGSLYLVGRLLGQLTGQESPGAVAL